jgi:hypothetical protein
MTAPNKSHGRTQDAWDKHCRNKRRYSDEFTARISAQHVINTQENAPRVMGVYQCENCRGWHMTKAKTRLPWVTSDDLFYIKTEKLNGKTVHQETRPDRRFTVQT